MAKRGGKKKTPAARKKNAVMVPVIAPAGTERSTEGKARVGVPTRGAVSDNPIGVGISRNPVGTPPGWEPPARHAPTGPALAQDEQVLVVWEKGNGSVGHEGKLAEIRRMAEKRRETGEIYKGTESVGKVYPNGTVETWHRYASNPLSACRLDVCSTDGPRRMDENPRSRESSYPMHSEETKLEYVERMRALEKQIDGMRDPVRREDLIARLAEMERDFRLITVWGKEREEPTHREWYREHRTPLRFEENPRGEKGPEVGALVRFDLRGATSPMYEGREYHETMVLRGSRPVRGGVERRLEMSGGRQFWSSLPIIEVSRWGPGPRRSEAYYRGDRTGERASDRPVGRHGERLSDAELHRAGLLDVGHPRRRVRALRWTTRSF